jgi:hypothetical protein
MAYIGPEPNPGQNREVDDISSGFNGSEVNFTLQVNSQNVSPGSSNAIIVSLGGVVQNPGTDYTVAASTLTFTTAPASGLAFFGLVLGQQVDTADANFNNPVITGDLSIADKIVHTGDTNTAIRFPAADTITAETAGSERVRVTSAGELLIGHSSARGVAGTANRKLQIEATDASASLSIARNGANSAGGFLSFGKSRSASTGGTTIVQDGDVLGTISFAGADGTNLESRGADISAEVDGTPGENDMPGRLVFKTSPDGSVSTTERMRINSSGKLLVGSSSDYAENVQAAFYGASNGGIALASGTSGLSRLMFADATSGNAGAFVGSIIYAHSDNSLRFNVNGGIERMRILSNGVLCIGRTTETVDFNNFGTSIGSVLSHSRAVTAASPSVAFYGAQGYAQVMGDGDLENTHGRYGSLSDQTLKENIVDANSQWNDIKNIKIRNFNFKESTGFATHKQIGVIAQELETVCPNLVDENDQGIKAVASSVLYMKAVKALQEAQARIETLETKVAALEAA